MLSSNTGADKGDLTTAGGLTAIVAYLIEHRRASKEERVAVAVRDGELAPLFLRRVAALERKCDERDARIDELQAHIAHSEGEHRRAAPRAEECEARYRELEVRVAQMKRENAG